MASQADEYLQTLGFNNTEIDNKFKDIIQFCISNHGNVDKITEMVLNLDEDTLQEFDVLQANMTKKMVTLLPREKLQDIKQEITNQIRASERPEFSALSEYYIHQHMKKLLGDMKDPLERIQYSIKSLKDGEINQECNVCLESVGEFLVFECNHQLCVECTKKLVQPVCHLCRKSLILTGKLGQ